MPRDRPLHTVPPAHRPETTAKSQKTDQWMDVGAVLRHWRCDMLNMCLFLLSVFNKSILTNNYSLKNKSSGKNFLNNFVALI